MNRGVLGCRGLLPQFAFLLAMAAGAPAQTAQTAAPAQTGVPNALQGFSQNRDQPVKIDSASLEVRDKDKVATFSGDVHLSQGDTTLSCKTLVVYYEDNSRSATLKAAQPGPGGQQQIRRLEVAESGALVRFSGGVAMILNLNRDAVTGSVGASSP